MKLDISVFRLYFVILAMLSVAFISCGGDDEDDEPQIEVPGQSLGEASKFVGTWEWYGKNGVFTFNADGTCHIESDDIVLHTQNRTYTGASGKWTYNPKTQILATDIKKWQWQVTLIEDDSWAGVTLDAETKTSMSFRRMK